MITVLAGSCGNKPKGKIGLSVFDLQNPYFKDISGTMTTEAKKLGYEVVTVSGDNNPDKQHEQVEDFIANKVKAIILTPINSDSIGRAIKLANKAGIPVFTVDIACKDSKAKVVCHIAFDNYVGGEQAAIAIHEALGGKGTVAILDFPRVQSVRLRTKGFKEKLKEFNKSPDVDIKIVAVLDGNAASGKSHNVTLDLLAKHPDLSGIFAINDPSALGAVAALKQKGKLGQVKVVGFDGSLDGRRAIKKGEIYADPLQSPHKLAKETIRIMVDYFDGKQPKKSVLLIPTKLYFKADADKDPALK